MSRQLIALFVLVPCLAFADESIAEQADDDEAEDDTIPDQSVGGQIGIAGGGGGGVTPGGLRISGHYLYQLSAQDWFDGTASFTFGGGGAECFRDRMDFVVCDHGFADGRAVEVVAAVRRYFAPQGKYVPFARLGVGISVVRFGDDDVTGVAIPIHFGGGVRANVAHQVAIVAQGELMAGLGRFGRGMGTEPQLGVAVTAGAEFRLP
ncbi:MAG: hypothetical protein M4D80_32200 [Myxococcota bacterium]|nr:hypothetical protein [Myxococcota bacterium]